MDLAGRVIVFKLIVIWLILALGINIYYTDTFREKATFKEEAKKKG